MTTSATDELYYDPWHADLNADPYPMFKRFRDEAPLYYNAVHDFYALSRFDDVNRALVDNQSLSSARGAVLEIIKSGIEIPSGLLVFEDPRSTTSTVICLRAPSPLARSMRSNR
jgi:cytochrome P450